MHDCRVADLYPLDNYFETWQGNYFFVNYRICNGFLQFWEFLS